MPKRDHSSPPRPTEAELGILRVLWRRGPSTVREVHEAVAGLAGTGYTTTLKLLQIMDEKGLVTRDTTKRAHVYRTQVEEEKTQKRLVGELLDRVFDGSATKLVLQALSSRPSTPAELDEIRRLIDEMEGRDQ